MANAAASLAGLATELHLEIASYLSSPTDLAHLLQTSRHFAALLPQMLYRLGVEYDGGYQMLAWAAEHSDLAMVQMAVEKYGACVNATHLTSGNTPLFHAAGNDTAAVAVARYLLEHGADGTRKNDVGYTLVVQAAMLGIPGPAILDQILKDPATAELVDMRTGVCCDATPLLIAVDAGFRGVAECLLRHGADVDATRYGDRRTGALQHALVSNRVGGQAQREGMLKLLLDYGINVEKALGHIRAQVILGNIFEDDSFREAMWLLDSMRAPEHLW